MERQKAGVRDQRSVKLAAGRELWKVRLFSMHQAHESAAGTNVGPLYPRETAAPNLSPAFVIAQILKRERGLRQRRTPHPYPWKCWLLQARVSLLRTHFRRSHPTRLVQFLSTPSVPAGPVVRSGPTHAGPAISLYSVDPHT